MAFWRMAGLSLLLCTFAACEGGGAAVSVRWRIHDLATGGLYDPREHTGLDGSCRCLPRDLANIDGTCASTSGWTVHRVRLLVLDPDSGEDLLVGDDRLVFRCDAREATTPFILPTGRFGIAVESYNPVNPTLTSRALSPPPTVRDLVASSKINLEVVEIGVNGGESP